MTANSVITRALIEIGAASAGETPSDEDMQLGLSDLQMMVNTWGADDLTIYAILRTTKTLAAFTASYTIGTGGDINIVRPEWINNVGLVMNTSATTPTEIALRLMTEDQWANLANKTLTAAQSSGIYFDHSWTAGLGTIYVWPIPTVGTTQLVLYTPLAITGFTTLSASVTFPPAYQEALTYNLAVRLATPFGRTVQPITMQMATRSLALLKTANLRPSELSIDRALIPMGSMYSIVSDTP